jgi:carboxypeptidase C (cathepsin A)
MITGIHRSISMGLAFLILAAIPCFGYGETRTEGEAKKPSSESASTVTAKEPGKKPWDQKPSVTRHTITVNGKPLRYTATAGYIPLTDESGKPAAYVFYTSYVAEGRDKTSRPLTFAFNGGPGAASVWLHMSAVGPKRFVLADDGTGLPPPYAWVDNGETWLDLTDLVFVDPVGTGYSRLAEGTKPEDFYGVDKDVESIAQFIRLYTMKNERWLSPKFLAGESYGTTRAAGLSKHLQDKTGMALNGLILISTAINFQTIAQAYYNDLAFALLLPSYALTAAYHKRLSPELQADVEKARKEVERFALTDYLVALAKGYTISASEREAMVNKLAAYTGLTPLTIRNSNLRIDRRTFARRLLEEKGLSLGLYDARFAAHYRAEGFMEDPSMFEVTAPMLSACNDYLRRDLDYENDLPYEFLSDKVNHDWKWGSSQGGYTDMTARMAMAMNQNRFLKVFVASGYYDLVTSYFAAKYLFDRMGPDQDLRDRITMEYYEGGHQLYMDKVTRQRLKTDVAAFFRKTVK